MPGMPCMSCCAAAGREASATSSIATKLRNREPSSAMNHPSPSDDACCRTVPAGGSARDPPFAIGVRGRLPVADAVASPLHLLPDVPQQHAANDIFAQVEQHAFLERLL